MAPKEWTQKQAKDDFKKRLLPREGLAKGHEPTMKFEENTWGEVVKVKCKKGCSFNAFSYYYNNASNDEYSVAVIQHGRLSITGYKVFNNHLISLQPKVIVLEQPTKVMHVKLLRVEHEWWLAHYESDFIEELQAKADQASTDAGKDPHQTTYYNRHSWYRGSNHSPWVTVKKDSQGWKRQGVWKSKEAGFASVLEYAEKHRSAGHGVEVYAPDDEIGIQAPVATIRTSVRKLIDGYKGLRETATPIEVKGYLQDVDDAISQMTILESLREDAQQRFLESMEL